MDGSLAPAKKGARQSERQKGASNELDGGGRWSRYSTGKPYRLCLARGSDAGRRPWRITGSTMDGEAVPRRSLSNSLPTRVAISDPLRQRSRDRDHAVFSLKEEPQE